MFAFNCEFLREEFHRLAADVSRPFENLKPPDKKSFIKKKGLRILDSWAGLDRAYHLTKKISFDYAVAVQCTRTVMVPASFDWTDAGSWDEYARLLSESFAGNSDGELYVSGTSTDAGNCFVDSDIPVALAGVEDLIVVIRSGKKGSPPAALITRKGETRRVRDIVEQIQKAGKTELL